MSPPLPGMVLAQIVSSVSPVRIWPTLKSWYGRQQGLVAMGHVRIVSDIRARQQVWLNVLPQGTRVMMFYRHHSIRMDHEALCGLSDIVTFQKSALA